MSSTHKHWRHLLKESDLPVDDKLLGGIVSELSQQSEKIFSPVKPPAINYSDVVLNRISKQIPLTSVKSPLKLEKSQKGLLRLGLPRLLASFSFALAIAALSLWVKTNNPKVNSSSENLVELVKNLQSTGQDRAQVWLASIGNSEDRMDIVGGNWAHEFSVSESDDKYGVEKLRNLETVLKSQDPSL
jgi:hypothetical protein